MRECGARMWCEDEMMEIDRQIRLIIYNNRRIISDGRTASASDYRMVRLMEMVRLVRLVVRLVMEMVVRRVVGSCILN